MLMLEICGDFAERNYIQFSAAKSVILTIVPSTANIAIKSDVYLGSSVLSYVDLFKYLGHIISSDLSDDADNHRERRSLDI